MPTSPTIPRRSDGSRTGARRHDGTGTVARLNAEWCTMCDDASTAVVVGTWAAQHDALAECTSLVDIEGAVTGAAPADADRILLTLLGLCHDGDALAGRVVLQLMLGKAVRIAAAHAARDSRENLEHAAVTALWTVIATYPTTRRPAKVAANIAMDAVHAVSVELAHRRTESPTEPGVLSEVCSAPSASSSAPADLELIELLAWAVDQGVVTTADATLIVDIYAPAPGEPGGATAAVRHEMSWPAARQRASRAVRKITSAIRADTVAAARPRPQVNRDAR